MLMQAVQRSPNRMDLVTLLHSSSFGICSDALQEVVVSYCGCNFHSFTGEVVQSVPHESEPCSTVGIHLWAPPMLGYYNKNLLCLVPMLRRRLVLTTQTPHTPWINAALVLSDGRVVTSSTKDTRIWSKDLQHFVFLQVMPDSQCALASLGDGSVVTSRYANTGLDSSMQLWDTEHCICVAELASVCEYVYCMVGAGKSYVVTSGSACFLRCWDLRGPFKHGHPLEYDTYLRGMASDMIALADGRVMFCGAFNGTRVWDLAQGSTVLTIGATQPPAVRMLQLFDHRVVIASVDAILRVWDVSSVECLVVLRGHTLPMGMQSIDSISAIAELPDGRIVSASYDKTLRVWDALTGECLIVMTRHQAAVVGVVVSGGLVYSGDSSGRVYIWE